MTEIQMKDLQVGQSYFIHQVKDEDTHESISRAYNGLCTTSYSNQHGWLEFVFENIKGLGTPDIKYINVSTLEDGCGFYKFYLPLTDSQMNEIKNTEMCNNSIKDMTGDDNCIIC